MLSWSIKLYFFFMLSFTLKWNVRILSNEQNLLIKKMVDPVYGSTCELPFCSINVHGVHIMSLQVLFLFLIFRL
jgi:hypothetical protein